MNSPIRISLYGNAILDYIYEKKSGYSKFKESRFGGIFNIARTLPKNYQIYCSFAINKSDQDYDFGFHSLPQISQKPTSSAKILYCLKTSSHESIVDFGACEDYRIFPIDAQWHHISYLNTLPSITKKQIQELNGITSADLCLGNFKSTEICKIFDLCEQIDYLFMSDKEALSLFHHKFENITRKATIIHSADSISVITKNSNKTFKFEIKNNINSLGCGDRFVAGFIIFAIQNQLFKVEDAAIYAYNFVSEQL